jgi:hypothetical protein
MTVAKNINAALNTRLAQLGADITIIWPNTKDQKLLPNVYIAPHLMPATTTLNNLDGTQLHKGIYQVDVYVKLETGLAVLTTALDSLIELFHNESLTANDDIVHVQAVGIGATERQDSWYRGFVEINYICYS